MSSRSGCSCLTPVIACATSRSVRRSWSFFSTFGVAMVSGDMLLSPVGGFDAMIEKVRKILRGAREAGRSALLEHEVYGVLAAAGLDVPRYAFWPGEPGARLPDGVRKLVDEAPGDFVLKIVSPEILHKTDVGGRRGRPGRRPSPWPPGGSGTASGSGCPDGPLGRPRRREGEGEGGLARRGDAPLRQAGPGLRAGPRPRPGRRPDGVVRRAERRRPRPSSCSRAGSARGSSGRIAARPPSPSSSGRAGSTRGPRSTSPRRRSGSRRWAPSRPLSARRPRPRSGDPLTLEELEVNPLLLAADGRWIVVDGKGRIGRSTVTLPTRGPCTRSKNLLEPKSRGGPGRLGVGDEPGPDHPAAT